MCYLFMAVNDNDGIRATNTMTSLKHISLPPSVATCVLSGPLGPAVYLAALTDGSNTNTSGLATGERY